jgi:hypothetical protein
MFDHVKEKAGFDAASQSAASHLFDPARGHFPIVARRGCA